MKKLGCVVLGGGGHARVLLESLRLSGVRSLAVIDPGLRGRTIDGVPVLGGDELLAELGKTHTRFMVGLGAVSDNRPRLRLYERASSAGLIPIAVAHPAAIVSKDAALVPGAMVFPGAVVNSGATVGANAIVNTGAIVEHGCCIGDHAHVASGAILCGDVRVERLAHVGAAAVVRQGLTIGENAVVGAGAVVVRDVLERAVVVGVPAVPLRPKTGGRA